jgi:hypothetical protein
MRGKVLDGNYSSETLAYNKSTRRHISEDSIRHRHENLKSCIDCIVLNCGMMDEFQRIWKEAVMPNQDTILVFAWKIEENLEKPQNIFRPS